MHALRRPSSAKLKVSRKKVFYCRMLHPLKIMNRRKRNVQMQNSSTRAMSLMSFSMSRALCPSPRTRFLNPPSLGQPSTVDSKNRLHHVVIICMLSSTMSLYYNCLKLYNLIFYIDLELNCNQANIFAPVVFWCRSLWVIMTSLFMTSYIWHHFLVQVWYWVQVIFGLNKNI